MTLGQQAQPATETIEVRDKSTGERIATLPVDDAANVEDVVARARAAQVEWARRPARERARILKQARKSLVADRKEILELLGRETGKTRFDVVGEMLGICTEIGYLARRAPRWLRPRRVTTRPLMGKRGRIFYKPHGVVGVIGPWNAPLVLTLGDALPALLAGNSVVLKPSEITPLAVNRAVAALNQVLPEAVLGVVNGRAETGAALVERIDMVAVTGSSATGRRVMERASARLTPVLLELGGKDPMIVLRDADLDRAARAGAWGSCFMTGQVCMGIERIYVEAPVAERFERKLVEQLERLRTGANGATAEIDYGPFTGPGQIDIVERHIEDARERGAKIATGGHRLSREGEGDFFEPTLITHADHSMKVMREETFGPVAALMVVEDVEEALRLANDSDLGLNASIWTRDIARGIALAQRLETGNVCVNDCVLSAGVPALPFGGVKQSGVGARHGGVEGFRQFCVPQSVMIESRKRKREPAWFPYRRSTAAKAEKLLAWLYGR